MGLGLRLALAAGLVPLARWNRGIVRRLWWQVQPLTQRRVLRNQCIDPCQQRADQRILLSRRQRGKIRRRSHRIVESRPQPYVNILWHPGAWPTIIARRLPQVSNYGKALSSVRLLGNSNMNEKIVRKRPVVSRRARD